MEWRREDRRLCLPLWELLVVIQLKLSVNASQAVKGGGMGQGAEFEYTSFTWKSTAIYLT